MSTIRILLCDDHTVLRAGLRLLIEREPDLEVVGEASNCAELLALVPTLLPDVVLLDLDLPDRSGLDAIPELTRTHPAARALVLSMHEDPAYVRRVVQAGGFGYLPKSAADSTLIHAIRSVHGGGYFLDRSLPGANLQELLAEPPAPTEPHTPLSRREREVLSLVAHGFTHREAAERLGVSVKSVETYRSRLANKLNLRTRAEIVRYALLQGILDGTPH